ncbi:U4/U6.U5 tri-snRNP-associated protein 1, putative [Plasmodium ovale]|uniref:U4/U6.U5 tri-snRNP-associated protein 1, putative n=1 Tax=Plasmodium ovale TaxID=36330 RepID=A0A1D3TGS6_PLAOA|nr:U4/U6.U5 tri-snRNP-associated protein 1, putative [Plasmodium ovale]
MDKECELSIEETNKLREKLGLKKLEVGEVHKDKDKHNQDDEKYAGNKRKGKGASENGKDIMKVEENKKKRRGNTKNKDIEEEKKKTKTISEQFNDDIEDVQNWVNKTRKTMNKKLADEGIKYSDDDEENKNKKKSKKKNNFVSNVKVEHKNEDITGEVILTLKDKHILKKKGDLEEDQEEEDCLINEDLKKQNMKSLLSKKDDSYWNKNYYNPLSYYEDMGKKSVIDSSSINMLPKYEEEKHSFDVSIKYDEDGKDNSQRGDEKNWGGEDNNEGVMKKGKGVLKRGSSRKERDTERGIQEKEDTKKNANNDNIFKLKKRKINNISRRKKEEDVWGFLYDEPGEESERDKTKKGKNHDGGDGNDQNKRTGGKGDANEQHEENAKANAGDILDDVIKKIKEEQMNMEFNYFDDVFSENEEDKELYELLQKGNTLKKRKKENYQNELLKYIVINEGGKKANDEKNSDIIKLTDASEFCKNISLPTDMHENDKKTKIKKGEQGDGISLEPSTSALAGNNRVNNAHHVSKYTAKENINENALASSYGSTGGDLIKSGEKIERKAHGDGDGDGDGDDDGYGDDDDDVDADDELGEFSHDGASEIFNEVKLDEGLYGALEYLKTKGELNMEDKIYRNPENKPLHMSTEKNEIKLDYKNDSGKVMTPKETFRYISWIFHGKKQGKNKLEKKIKRMEVERRFKENPMDSMPTLNVLKKYQQMQKKSYFTLSSNN